jgi:hypothetical protein
MALALYAFAPEESREGVGLVGLGETDDFLRDLQTLGEFQQGYNELRLCS